MGKVEGCEPPAGTEIKPTAELKLFFLIVKHCTVYDYHNTLIKFKTSILGIKKKKRNTL